MGTFYVIPKDEDLLHYGILGMKWGVRRYQNADGSLTSAGEKRYLKGARASGALGRTIGNALFGPIGGALLAQKAYNTQVKSNTEKIEREEMAKKLSEMSDEELREFNYRKNLENQLSSILSKENKNTGINFVKDLLGIAGSTSKIISDITGTTATLSSPSKKKINEIRKKGEAEGKSQDVINKEIAALTKEATANNIRLLTAKKTADNTGKYINITTNTIQQIAKEFNNGKTIDTSDLSNKELQKLVDRMRMEQQYLDIVSPTNTRNGAEYVKDVVSSTADLTGTAASTIKFVKSFK